MKEVLEGVHMPLTWNTLEEAATYLSSETNKNWTKREVIQACLDNGIFPHVQILTDRQELPVWMREGEMAELPFNLDLQRFLSGDGIVHIVRRDGLIYKMTPGIKYETEHLRLSKTALCDLLARHKQKIEQPSQQAIKLSATRSITKQQVIIKFQGIYWDAVKWNKYLGDPPKWLEECRVSKGTRSKNNPSTWNPVQIAIALTEKGVSLNKLDAVFVNLKDWQDEWMEKSDYLR